MKHIIAIAAVIAMTGCGMEQVDEGYRGVELVWGKAQSKVLGPGLYFYNPLSTSILEVDVREHKVEGDESCFTADTQNVVVRFAVTLYPRPEKSVEIYSQFGTSLVQKTVLPAVASSLKDTIGQYKADDLVGKREEARVKILKELQDTLAKRDIVVTRLDIVNLDFDDAYEKAVEAKVVAVQRAQEAKNKTVQIEEEAKQKVASAEADARAMKIKSQALQENKGLVQYEAVQRWDGKLPEIMLGNSVPIINLGDLKAQGK